MVKIKEVTTEEVPVQRVAAKLTSQDAKRSDADSLIKLIGDIIRHIVGPWNFRYAASVCRELCSPILAVLAFWSLLIWPDATLYFCPVLWEVEGGSKNANFWQLDRDTKRRSMLMWPYALLVIVIMVYSALLVGVINITLPRVISGFVNRCARWLWNHSLGAVLRLVWFGRFLACYTVAFVMTAQSCRNRSRRGEFEDTVGHAAGAIFMLTLLLQLRRDSAIMLDRWFVFALLSISVCWPLSFTMESELFGFAVIGAIHAVCTLSLKKCGLGSRFGSGWKQALGCASMASAALVFSLMLLRYATGNAKWLLIFCVGGSCFGHIGYFAMLMVLTSTFVVESTKKVEAGECYSPEWLRMQGVMVFSLSFTLFLGIELDSVGLRSVVHVAIVCWLMVKEMELKTDSTAFKLMAAYLLWQFLDKESLLKMFDPRGLYV